MDRVDGAAGDVLAGELAGAPSSDAGCKFAAPIPSSSHSNEQF
jgi:hypothetical protein